MTAGSYLRNTTEPTDTDIEDIFVGLDTQFNEVMINALTHGERIQTRMGAQGTLTTDLFRRDIHWSSRHLTDYWSILFASTDAPLSNW